MDENDDKLELEYSSNVSSTIMMKVPTACLVTLRNCFENEAKGLNLVQFLHAFVKNMDLESNEMLLKIVPDLVDLFCLVDVNGDEHMEWSEFVMFVIEQVVQDKDFTIYERFEDVSHTALQPPASRQAVQCSKMLPHINRLFVGVGSEIQIFNSNAQSTTWLTDGDVLALHGKDKKPTHDTVGFLTFDSGKGDKGPKPDALLYEVVDIAFLPSKDILFTLRTDLCVEFHRLTSRTSFLPENMEHCGFWHLKNPHIRLQIRDIPEESWRLFIIGNTSDIESWLITVGERGHVEISDPQLMSMHTDYVRDILIIANDQYSLLVSCSLDKKVILWDLRLMTFKSIKTGHTAGVQCLAFDNRSTLFAGGFDYSIIGWDLDAQISKPIIILNGHQANITKVVAIGSVDRCVSLDTNGEIRFWDTSRANPNDDDRQISQLFCLEDHVRTFEVFGDVGTRFPTSHGIILATQGRRQHVYRITDYADKISPPLDVFFSAPLLMCISVHANHIAFWSAVTGHEQNIMKLGKDTGLAVEVTSAVLDDRSRKLIVGDSNGVISVYNGLTSVKLKSFKPMPYAIRFLRYTPDRTIIAIAGAGDMHIFDELPSEDSDSQLHLRDARAHDADVVAITYSAKLGLIATADCTGCLVVWNYEFLSVELILNNFLDGDIGQLVFLEPFPLLLVTGSSSTLTIIPVGSGLRESGRKLWQVQMSVPVKDDLESVASELTQEELMCGEDIMDEADLEGLPSQVNGAVMADPEAGVAVSGEVIITSARLNADSAEVLPNTSSIASAKVTSSLVSSKGTPSLVSVKAGPSSSLVLSKGTPSLVSAKASASMKTASVSAAGQSGGVSAKLMSREASASPTPASPVPSSSQKASGLMSSKMTLSMKEEEEEAKSDAGSGEEEDVDDNDESVSTLQKQRMAFGPKKLREYLLKRREARSACAHVESEFFPLNAPAEDIVKTTLEKILEERERERLLKTQGYLDSPRDRLAEAAAGADDLPDDLSYASLMNVPAGITVKVFIGYDDGTIASCNLTAAIRKIGVGMLPVDVTGSSRRGYNPRRHCSRSIRLSDISKFGWSPADIDKGTVSLSCPVVTVWQAHSASVTTLRVVGDSADLLSGSDDHAIELWTSEGALKGVLTRGREFDKLFRPRWRTPVDMVARNTRRAGDAEVLVNELQLKIREKKQKGERRKGFSVNRQPKLTKKYVSPVVALPSIDELNASKAADFEEEPDYLRAVGQLAGKITYHVSNKDNARIESLAKFNQTMKELKSIGHVKKKKKKSGKSRRASVASEASDDDPSEAASVNPFLDPAYMNEIMSDSESDAIVHTAAVSSGGKGHTVSASLLTGKRERHIKSKYDLELAAIDAADPNNWEIHSSNRQRSMYNHLFTELDILGKTKDHHLVFEVKLNKLSPGGDFKAFVSTIRKQRLAAKNQILANMQQSKAQSATEGRSAILVATTSAAAITTVEGSGQTTGVEVVTGNAEDSDDEDEENDDESVVEAVGDRDTDRVKSPLTLAMSPKKPRAVRVAEEALLKPSQIVKPSEIIAKAALSPQPVKQRTEPAFRRLSNSGTFASKLHSMIAAPIPKPSEVTAVAAGHRKQPTELLTSRTTKLASISLSKSMPELKPSELLAEEAKSKARLEALSKSVKFPPLMSTSGRTSSAKEGDVSSAAASRKSGRLTQALAPKVSAITEVDDESSAASAPDKELKIVEEAISKFETSVETVERLSRMSRRESKRECRYVIRNNATIDHAKLIEIAKNHSTSALMLQSQSSVVGVLEVTMRQKAAEQNWIRKVSMAMQDGFAEEHSNLYDSSRGSLSQDDSFSTRRVTEKKKLTDVKLLAAKSFGPYPVAELLKFLKAFDSLPQQLHKPSKDGGESSIVGEALVVVEPSPGEVKLATIAESGDQHDENEDEEDEDEDEEDFDEEYGNPYRPRKRQESEASESDGAGQEAAASAAIDVVGLSQAVTAAVEMKAHGMSSTALPSNAAKSPKGQGFSHPANHAPTQPPVFPLILDRQDSSPIGRLMKTLADHHANHIEANKGGRSTTPTSKSKSSKSKSSKSKKLRALKATATGSAKAPPRKSTASESGSPNATSKGSPDKSVQASDDVGDEGSVNSMTEDADYFDNMDDSSPGREPTTGSDSAKGQSSPDSAKAAAASTQPKRGSIIVLTSDPSSSAGQPTTGSNQSGGGGGGAGPATSVTFANASETSEQLLSEVSSPKPGVSIVAPDRRVTVVDTLAKARLSLLIKHKYFKRVPEWHYALERLLTRKTSSAPDGNVDDWVSLHEILVEMCPHMTPVERSECIRFLTLKSQKDNMADIRGKKKAAEKAKQTALAARFKNLQSIFSFFDRANVGEVDIQEILTVLKKTVANRQQEKKEIIIHGETVNYHDVHALHKHATDDDPLVAVIASIDDGRSQNLNFTEFVQLFEHVFGY